ncbi:MAG: hypothetical protein S4CHLAM102_07660 [Chlamydiia bacterium]|nr:hypothetical protein [Chlamydiia bacterium]
MQVEFPRQNKNTPENDLSIKLWRYRYQISTGILFVIAFAMLVTTWLKRESRFFFDHLKAQQELARVLSDPKALPGALSGISEMFDRYPETKGGAEGQIGQMLIADGRVDEAQRFGSDMLKRVKFNHSFYQDFSQNTLLVLEKNYDEALKRSVGLQGDMKKNRAITTSQGGYGAILFAFNLFRIASLHRELGQFEEELAALEELEKYVTSPSQGNGDTLVSMKQGLAQFSNHFESGKVGLMDYVQMRIKYLKTNP